MTRFDKDFLGNEINIGDRVIFEAPIYRSFAIGTVVTKAEKTCQIQYINNWNYPEGEAMVVRQVYEQIIKCPDTDAVPKVECSLCSEKSTKCIVDLQEELANARAEIESLKKENKRLATEAKNEQLSQTNAIYQPKNEISQTEAESAASTIRQVENFLQYYCRVFRLDGSPEGYIKADIDKMVDELKKKYKLKEKE